MKYTIVKMDYERFYTHAYFKTGAEDLSKFEIVGYANTKAEASAKVKELGFYILK